MMGKKLSPACVVGVRLYVEEVREILARHADDLDLCEYLDGVLEKEEFYRTAGREPAEPIPPHVQTDRGGLVKE